MDTTTLLLILVPFAFVLLGAALFVRAAGALGAAREDDDGRRAPGRPWWGNPLLWIGVCAAFAVLGLGIAPRLFGMVFLFLPFIWGGGMRRRREPR